MPAETDKTIATPVTVANGGTGLTAGTSGGIPAFTATGTIGSSALLAANALMVGGGAGVAPSTITTGAGVLTALSIAPNAAGGFSTLRSYTGSASLNGVSVAAFSLTPIAITVTGAASGDKATVNFPVSDNSGIALQGPIVVTSNTVTVYLYAASDDGILYPDATWTNGQFITAQIIK